MGAANKKIIIVNPDDDVDITPEEKGLLGVMPVEIVDGSGEQITNFGSGGYSTVGDGTATVITTDTRVQLSAQSCKQVIITAHESNTGLIVIGGATVVAASGTRRGTPLYPTQSAIFYVSNLNLLYIDSTASGDKITYTYEN